MSQQKMPNLSGRRSRTSLWALGMFGAMAGILLYSKLKLTTAMPRSAYAVPEETEDAKSPGVEGSESVTPREDESDDSDSGVGGSSEG